MKIRGHRIELGEVQLALERVHGVRQAVVVAREDAGGERAVAYVLADPETVARWRDALAETLPAVMQPSAFVRLDAFPLTSSGKVDRRALPPPSDVPRSREGTHAAAPRTPVEELLRDLWADFLHVEHIGLDDDFFALGGHSILATQFVARVRAVLGLGCRSPTSSSIQPLRRWRRLSAGASVTDAGRRGDPGAGTRRVHDGQEGYRPAPLSFAQQRLWFLDQLEPGNPASDIASVIRPRGALDVAALAASLSDLAQRHEVLRTHVEVRDDEPVQVVEPARPVPLPIEDSTRPRRGRRTRSFAGVPPRKRWRRSTSRPDRCSAPASCGSTPTSTCCC